MSSLAVREEQNLRSEIRDLTDYIAGLPDELQASGAFAPYGARLRELQEQLAVTELQNLDFPRDYAVELIEQQHIPETRGSGWLNELSEIARRQEVVRRREAAFYDRLVGVLSAGTLIGAAAAGLAALTAPVAGSLLAGGAATFAAVLHFSGAFRKLQREQMDIARLRVLRGELEALAVRNSEHRLGEEDVRELSRRVVFLFSEHSGRESSHKSAFGI